MQRTLFRSKNKSAIQKLFSNEVTNSAANKPSLATYIAPPTLVTKQVLEQADLKKLFDHEITALKIKSFYPPSYAQKIADELTAKATNGEIDNWRVVTGGRGLEVSDVWTEGEYIPYNVAVATDRVDEYHEGVARDFRKRRFIPDDSEEETGKIRPRLWPLDQLRLELDEVWMDGAGLARDKSKRVQGGGLPRIMMGPTRWKEGFVHADQYSPLMKEEGLFSGNIYLQLPSKEENANDNGELNIWNLEIYSAMDWHKYQDLLQGMTIQDAELQMELRKELGNPLKIHVEAGDLVLFSVQKPHCAVGFSEKSARISLQCFIQYRMGDRLLIDI